MKRLLAVFLAGALCCTLVPAVSAAGEEVTSETSAVVETEPSAPTAVTDTETAADPETASVSVFHSAGDAASYTYTVTPVIEPFGYVVYVRTDNPDMSGLRFLDPDSADADGGEESAYVLCERNFADVVYEDASAYRVHGGFLFHSSGACPDGGELRLQTWNGSSWSDTGVTVPAPAMKSSIRYLLDTYTTESQTFFEKLSAIQTGLNAIAVYPKRVLDKSRPNESMPYPLLAASPYPELSLNTHTNQMYLSSEGGSLAYYAYPYVLDSLGFPGTMAACAQALDPSCTVEKTGTHYLYKITLDGTTKTYGGAGSGSTNPVYTDRLTATFRFDGSSDDFGPQPTLNEEHELLMGYNTASNTDAQAALDLISGDTFRDTIGEGSWIRVAQEGATIDYHTYAYAAHSPKADGRPNIISNGWVDGRYINNREVWEPGAAFEDHATADIVLQDLTFTDKNGNTRTWDVMFEYDATDDRWEANYYYAGNWYYTTNQTLPDDLILTHDEVDALFDSWEAAGKTNLPPASAKVYNGLQYPGTDMDTVYTSGVTITKGHAYLGVGGHCRYSAEVTPSDATNTSVTWSVGDSSLVTIYRDGTLYAGDTAGSTTVTASAEGGLSDSIVLTVVNLYDDVTDPNNSFFDSVYWAKEAGITYGIGNNLFGLRDTVTRGQMITFVYRYYLNAASDGNTYDTGTQAGSIPFTDVSLSDYYGQAVAWAYRNGITSGTSATTFSPGSPVTRAQMVSFLYRASVAFGTTDPGETPAPAGFTDVLQGSYYYQAVNWAASLGIAAGYGDGVFGPGDNCLRGQGVTFLCRSDRAGVLTA